MGKFIEKDGFTLEVTASKLRIGLFEFSASEANTITGLLSFAGQMASLPGLPPSIRHTPFEISFSSTGNHLLRREGTKGVVQFRFEQLDALVETINTGVESHKNTLDVQRSDRSRARGRMQAGVNTPDIIDGRG